MSTTETQPGTSLPAALLRGVRRYWVWIALGLVVLFSLRLIFGGHKDEDPYRTAPVDRGAITRVVSATGTLAPLVSANVGSTVSGPVKEVLVDFNSHVRAGQVLARLDPSSFQQAVIRAQATLSGAQAQLGVAQADYERYQRLQQAGFASDQLMNQQRAARDSARANVSQANAQLASARTDLSRSVITSPIDGVVVDRQVNIGQSVAASFQAATLFVIAQDLSRLQANITVDEADIGEVQQGQQVRFTVDAFPDSEFDGRISQVRQQGVDTQGVVSYTVVVQADNPGGRLLPGMTANAEIIIDQTDNVLRMPSAALRFRPADPDIAARGQAMAAEVSGQGQAAGGRQRRQGGGQGGAGEVAAPGGAGQGAAQGGGRQGGGRGLGQLAQQLELTPAQQAQANEAFQTAMASAGPRPGQDAEQGERRAYQRRIRDAAMRQIEPTLNAHQRQLLAAVRNAPPGQQRRVVTRQAVAWVLRNNKPSPVRVTLGVADDSHTTILGGDLKEGDEVIIGGGPRQPNAPGQQQRGPSPLGGGVRIRG